MCLLTVCTAAPSACKSSPDPDMLRTSIQIISYTIDRNSTLNGIRDAKARTWEIQMEGHKENRGCAANEPVLGSRVCGYQEQVALKNCQKWNTCYHFSLKFHCSELSHYLFSPFSCSIGSSKCDGSLCP
jgi:hypothetical protein